MEVREPYERLACNALRRECYRRKLRVVKSGDGANATKSGFMALLRDDDARRIEPAEWAAVEEDEEDPAPVLVGNKRQRTAGEREGVATSQGSFLSTQTSFGSALEVEVATPPAWIVPTAEMEKEVHAVGFSSGEARWERLYTRLETVTHKLRELRARGDAWLVDGRDVEFYETLKRQLQRQLLDCVTQV